MPTLVNADFADAAPVSKLALDRVGRALVAQSRLAQSNAVFAQTHIGDVFSDKEIPMVEIITVIAIVLAVAIAIVLILAATKPGSFSVERAISVGAPPERIFPLINDFHQWVSWSPYENKDPAMKRSYSGAASGKGAVYGWDGNNNVGSGRMEILDAEIQETEHRDSMAPSKILIKLDFFKPFEGHNTAEFTMLPQGDATRLVWAMRGPAPFMSKLMQVFINLDQMVGRDFEVGLANLKKLTEK
jgi:Polyketide cyclase / dehydrase and lipid transport